MGRERITEAVEVPQDADDGSFIQFVAMDGEEDPSPSGVRETPFIPTSWRIHDA
jgi:hypothetical protein